MRMIALSMSILLAACSAAPGPSPTTAPAPVRGTSTSPAPTDTTEPTSTSSADNADPSPATAPEAQPAYDVFLAAVAEAAEGTRYADTPFESPEVVVSTGLALCEAIADGQDPNSVVFEYLSALVGGSPDEADDDQLVFVGAVIGAAETALCPDAR